MQFLAEMSAATRRATPTAASTDVWASHLSRWPGRLDRVPNLEPDYLEPFCLRLLPETFWLNGFAPETQETTRTLNFKVSIRFLGFLIFGFLFVLVSCLFVSWFQRLLVSWFLGFINSVMFLKNTWSVLPNCHFMFLIDIDLVSKISKFRLHGSSSFPGAHSFQNCQNIYFWNSEVYTNAIF